MKLIILIAIASGISSSTLIPNPAETQYIDLTKIHLIMSSIVYQTELNTK